MIPGSTHRLAIEQPPGRVLARLPRVIESWGGTVTGDAGDASGAGVEVPVLAGLRRGRLRGRLQVRAAGAGSEAVLVVASVELQINLAACAILVLSAAGAVTSVAWPWFPRLLPAVPLGLVLAVGGWLLVASRLRAAGPEELLLALQAVSTLPDEEADTIENAEGE